MPQLRRIRQIEPDDAGAPASAPGVRLQRVVPVVSIGIVRGPDVIGRHWTRYLALTGRTVDAAFAERIGLVQEVHLDDVLLEAAIGLAREVAGNSPLAVQVGKAFVNRGTETGYPESVEAVALLFGTDEHREAVAAFRARRP